MSPNKRSRSKHARESMIKRTSNPAIRSLNATSLQSDYRTISNATAAAIRSLNPTSLQSVNRSISNATAIRSATSSVNRTCSIPAIRTENTEIRSLNATYNIRRVNRTCSKSANRTQNESSLLSGESVSKKTFESWGSDLTRDFKIIKCDAKEIIRELQCEICYHFQNEIVAEALRLGFHGQAAAKFKNRTFMIFKNVKKCNLLRHIRSGGLHTWARRKYVERVDGYSDTTNSSQSFSASPISSVKPNRTYTIDNAFSSRKSNQLNQTIKHLRTALYIAEYERPLSDFGKLIHALILCTPFLLCLQLSTIYFRASTRGRY